MQKKSLELLVQVQKIIRSYDFALTLRQIYYQLVAKQIIPNQQRFYKKLSRLCVIGRDEGILPEDAFADRLRQVDRLASYHDLADYMATVGVAYRKNKWENQNSYIEIWTEKDALRDVLSEITYAYDVNLMVVRGQVSRTAIFESYERFAENLERGKNCHLYYAGDFDPSGLSIFNSLKERIRQYGTDGERITFERIALTPEQIDAYNLPSDPGKQSDPNYKRFVSEYGDSVVELDSLPPEALRDIVRNCIEKHIDQVLLSQVREIEQEEQTILQTLTQAWQGVN
ncbi:MAG: hypothetical protein B1H12_11195 [Desulfobacteraceae bacterium 4484_190.2]|nr:MAG: hypothetical protein B1H12_11195 [Desulfobacteraceae bacterium 4484_190.2]